MTIQLHKFGREAALYAGDCRDALKHLPDNSIDSVVTDPPYALVSITKRFGGKDAAPAQHGTDGLYARASKGFMGKTWDTGETAFAVTFWAEVLRVLKPGGHVIAFSGTRTYHRLAVAIEDAGFEIRDQLGWLYGQGFPKSRDVSKGIDKMLGREREVIGKYARPDGTDRDYEDWRINSGEWKDGSGFDPSKRDITAPASEEAAQWQGWGTALKPSWEPICLARKPLEGTVAQNVLRWGTGALNIDGCRIGTESIVSTSHSGDKYAKLKRKELATGPMYSTHTGRWPANISHDGSPAALAVFPESKSSSKGSKRKAKGVLKHGGTNSRPGHSDEGGDTIRPGYEDKGSAARFFYCAKADKKDRAGSGHPTVKPIDLMRNYCRLVTPPGGIVLDPFAGSGTTLEAALAEGFKAIGCEREPEYVADIQRRLIML